jgi:pyrroloquinoline quinone biosynthesis protein D
VIELDTHVRLARKVRLRRDPQSNKMMLLYPERGLALSDSAADVAALCDGRTAGAIAVELCARYAGVAREQVEHDVLAFLRSLAERGLLAGDEAAP